MSSLERRVEELEEAGHGDGPGIVVDCGDLLWVNGRKMTREEFNERWPDYAADATIAVGGLDLEHDI